MTISTEEICKTITERGLDCVSDVERLELLARLERAEKERDALRAKIEAAEKERDECNRRRLEAADHFAAQTELMKEQLETLRAKIEQMEPVGEVVEDDFCKVVKGINSWRLLPNGAKLYALPGAQGE